MIDMSGVNNRLLGVFADLVFYRRPRLHLEPTTMAAPQDLFKHIVLHKVNEPDFQVKFMLCVPAACIFFSIAADMCLREEAISALALTNPNHHHELFRPKVTVVPAAGVDDDRSEPPPDTPLRPIIVEDVTQLRPSDNLAGFRSEYDLSPVESDSSRHLGPLGEAMGRSSSSRASSISDFHDGEEPNGEPLESSWSSYDPSLSNISPPIDITPVHPQNSTRRLSLQWIRLQLGLIV